MIFVSSSMSLDNIANYAISARSNNGVLVFRGLINHSFKQTAQFVQSLTEQGAIAIIDPLSFKRFNISHVPTIIVISDDHNCSMGRCEQTPLHDKISGNITVEYALERIIEEGEFSKKEAARFLEKIRS